LSEDPLAVFCQTGTCRPVDSIIPLDGNFTLACNEQTACGLVAPRIVDGPDPIGIVCRPLEEVCTECVPFEETCYTQLLGVCADGSICTEENTRGTCANGDSCDTQNPCADLSQCQPICDSDGSVCKPGPAGSTDACTTAIGDGKGKKAGDDCAIVPKASSDDCSNFNPGEECCGSDDEAVCEECEHDLCEPGLALDLFCDPCVTQVCLADPFCCDDENGSWNSRCIVEADEICGICQLETVIGESTKFIPREDACGNVYTCESLVGNITTDSMRLTYGTDFAITNYGGLRNDLTCPTTDEPDDFCPAYTPPPYPITRGQVFTVLPFGDFVVTLEVNGAELKAMLENGVSRMPVPLGLFPQVSGLCFTYDISAPVGSRVLGAVRQAVDGSCTGPPVDLTAASTYTIAENNYMSTGGDGYPNFSSRATTQDYMDQVLADYISANSLVSPFIQGRITCTTSGATPCPVVVP
jgi:hypothetical protein